jgi:hypothetical protein
MTIWTIDVARAVHAHITPVKTERLLYLLAYVESKYGDSIYERAYFLVADSVCRPSQPHTLHTREMSFMFRPDRFQHRLESYPDQTDQ